MKTKLHETHITECCNAMLDGYSMESVLKRWNNQVDDTLDKEDTRKRIRERISQYKKYEELR
jgi:hypothetical protein